MVCRYGVAPTVSNSLWLDESLQCHPLAPFLRLPAIRLTTTHTADVRSTAQLDQDFDLSLRLM